MGGVKHRGRRRGTLERGLRDNGVQEVVIGSR